MIKNSQEYIVRETVPADSNPQYDISPGNATCDKVFLLSSVEVEKNSARTASESANRRHKPNAKAFLPTVSELVRGGCAHPAVIPRVLHMSATRDSYTTMVIL